MENDPDIRVVNATFSYKLGDQIKSEGNRGTLVFKGLFNGTIPIALKRYQKFDGNTIKDVQNDLDILTSPENRHPNFIRYYGHTTDDNFMYLATELCECSVSDIIDPRRKSTAQEKTPYFHDIVASLSKKEILRQSSEAVSFLHRPKWNMIHRNLHPDNFLIACVDPNKDYFLIKLTDFKLSKSIEKNPQNTGTLNKEGWVAPESFKDNIELDKSVDAFILGCYYFYVLSGGKHPFGRGVVDQRTRIKDEKDRVYQDSWDGKPEWDIDQANLNKKEEAKWAFEVIKGLIKYDPRERKLVDEGLQSKYFQSHPHGRQSSFTPGQSIIQESQRRVGELIYDQHSIIGQGDFSFVFSGFYRNSLPVAVKRKQRHSFITDSGDDGFLLREQRLQFQSTGHPNILHHFCTEADEDFIYIATELCAGTLQEYVSGIYQGPKFEDEREMLHQLTKGVAYLHDHHIIHRNIKPTNIMIYLADNGGMAQMKLNIAASINKKLKTGKEDVTNTSLINPKGTRGWTAPELYHLERYDVKVDIWTLGCVFAYVLTNSMKHPFGDDVYERVNRIYQKKNMLLNIEDLKRPYCYDRLAFELIQSMLEIKSSRRPSAEEVLNHVFFKSLNHSVETVNVTSSVLRKLNDNLSYYYGSKEHFLGGGGFAKVFLGIWIKDPSSDHLVDKLKEKKVAVKRIEKDPSRSQEQYLSFQKEVEVMLKVENHPNILQCITTHMNFDFLFIVTELCNGTLESWLVGTYQGLPIGDERSILFQATNGLAYLHTNRIVHRDIKPCNILISYPEMEGAMPLIKLADFGISRILTNKNGFKNTDKNCPLGTRDYMPPEMFKFNDYDFKVDIYGLGCVFGQVLSKEKRHPFDKAIHIGSTMILKLEDMKEPYSNDCLAFELIKSMGNVKSEDRPTAQKVLAHPFFDPLMTII